MPLLNLPNLKEKLGQIDSKSALSFLRGLFRKFNAFFRREGDFLILFKKKIDISSQIPYIPLVSIVGFVSLFYLGSTALEGSLISSQFIIWDEAIIVSSLESIDRFTPLVSEKESSFYKALKVSLDRPKVSLTEGGAYIVSQSRLATRISKIEKRKEIIEYTVAQGDTLSSIASKFGLKVETLKWANNIEDVNTILPGQVLKIPPCDGVLVTVKEGHTLLGLVNEYGGDFNETLKVNGITDASKIYPGQKIIIAGGKISETYSTPSYIAIKPSPPPSSPQALIGGGFPNNFPYGWCTWYVASRRYVPWSGNAGDWYFNAQAMGYAVGSVPQPGAIVVLRESWWGHVAIVEAVYGNSFLISEMNGIAGWGRVSTRILSVNDGRIVGFIY